MKHQTLLGEFRKSAFIFIVGFIFVLSSLSARAQAQLNSQMQAAQAQAQTQVQVSAQVEAQNQTGASSAQLIRCQDLSKDFVLNIFESLKDFKLSKDYLLTVSPDQVTKFSLHLVKDENEFWDLTQDLKFIKLRVASDYVDSGFEVIAMGVYADERPLNLLRFKCLAVTKDAVLFSSEENKNLEKKEAMEVQNEQESYHRP